MCVVRSYDVDLRCLEIYILDQFNMIVFVCIMVRVFRMIQVNTNKQTRSDNIGLAKSKRAQLSRSSANRQSTRPGEGLQYEKRGVSVKKLWCCVGGKYNKIIEFV